MRILHIAPHYGGGIAPAVIGIIEAIPASHVLVEIEKTRDSASIQLFNELGIFLRSISSLRMEDVGVVAADFVIFHFWDSHLWSQLASVESVCLIRGSILLNHQAFMFNGTNAYYVGELFDACVQSGFIGDGLPQNWALVPTCKSEKNMTRVVLQREQKAVYIGTLDYKKVSKDFFIITNQLSDANIKVDIYGKLLDDIFAKDLRMFQSPNVKYKGYSLEKVPILRKSTFFLYPLRSNHYGTTENALLEAMTEGVIPLVKRNSVETVILGEDLMTSLNIDRCLTKPNYEFFESNKIRSELSNLVRLRALELTNVKLRQCVWEPILSNTSRKSTRCSISELANQIYLIGERFSGTSSTKT